jgi:hypothetical protein
MSLRSLLVPHRLALALATAGALTGCGVGALNGAVVAGDCKPGAPGCEDAVLDGPLAVGASFSPHVKIELDGSTAPGMHLESAATDVLAIEGERVVARTAGMSALLFVTDDGTVVDFLHVFAKVPTKLALERVEADGSSEMASTGIDLLVGETLRLRATPLGEGQPLAGSLPVQWSVTPPDAAEMLSDGNPNKRRLLATAPGTATVKVRSGELVTELQIVVHARPRGAVAMEVSR